MTTIQWQLTNKDSLAERVDRARKAREFASIDRKGKGSGVVVVPGHDGKTYNVIYKWYNVAGVQVLRAECRLDMRFGHRDCPGACSSVCYHAIACALSLAGDKPVSICHSPGDARRLLNVNKGGKLFAIRSRQSGRTVWGVVAT